MTDCDGLTDRQALALCVLRSGDLTGTEIKFVQKLMKSDAIKPEQRLRLEHIVRRLRQGSLLAAAANDIGEAHT